MGTGKTLDIAREFEIQVDRVQIAENGGSSLTIIIVIVVILIIIAIILIAMTTVYAKNNSKLCYQNSQRPYIKPDINVSGGYLYNLKKNLKTLFQFFN